MLRFKITYLWIWKIKVNLNTSYVKVQGITNILKNSITKYLNTSYVKVQGSTYINYMHIFIHLNTSYVKVQVNRTALTVKEFAFKYILC